MARKTQLSPKYVKIVKELYVTEQNCMIGFILNMKRGLSISAYNLFS